MNDDRKDTHDNAATAADDWLGRYLTEDAAVHRDAYVADGGFTARVMAMLPPPAMLPAWRKPAVVALWGVAFAGLAMALPQAMQDVGREAYRLLATQPVSLSGIAGVAVTLVGATWAAAAYSLRPSE